MGRRAWLAPLPDHIKAEHENLIGLGDRMKTRTWGEDWAIATEKQEKEERRTSQEERGEDEVFSTRKDTGINN